MRRWKVRFQYVSRRLPQGQYSSIQIADWWVSLMSGLWTGAEKWAARRALCDFLEEDAIPPPELAYVIDKFNEVGWVEQVYCQKDTRY